VPFRLRPEESRFIALNTVFPWFCARITRFQKYCIYIQLFCQRLQSSLMINFGKKTVVPSNMSQEATAQQALTGPF
jgi:hypothetical protein